MHIVIIVTHKIIAYLLTLKLYHLKNTDILHSLKKNLLCYSIMYDQLISHMKHISMISLKTVSYLLSNIVHVIPRFFQGENQKAAIQIP